MIPFLEIKVALKHVNSLISPHIRTQPCLTSSQLAHPSGDVHPRQVGTSLNRVIDKLVERSLGLLRWEGIVDRLGECGEC